MTVQYKQKLYLKKRLDACFSIFPSAHVKQHRNVVLGAKMSNEIKMWILDLRIPQIPLLSWKSFSDKLKRNFY